MSNTMMLNDKQKNAIWNKLGVQNLPPMLKMRIITEVMNQNNIPNRNLENNITRYLSSSNWKSKNIINNLRKMNSNKL